MIHRTVVIAIMLLVLAPLTAWAQPSQPYAGMQERRIKSLSEQQIADLKAGRGMGLAQVAELNGYPGPAHVLELADKLGLGADQKEQVKRLFEAMQDETSRIGEQIIDAEAELDRGFAAGSISETGMQEQVRAIAELQGRLRAAHLRYHLVVARLLTPEQIARYNELRGYGGTHGGHAHQH
ncbi:MAG TPA: Spy/CpxP family protein refolding chaperone [Reyranella sp.]|jgi:Spy/CpxP family protein refolding chaperone|nr:Spy/CpxP family protein refolding chaperone [Reyranella sp.]